MDIPAGSIDISMDKALTIGRPLVGSAHGF